MAQVVPPPYIEPGFALRFYPGDEDTRLGWVPLVSGNYGLAEQHYRRAVEATHQNGSAWIGPAASYDRLGRFDSADFAYRHAIRLEGENYIILNNRGYSYLLSGDIRRARRLLERAMLLAPGDPTILAGRAHLSALSDHVGSINRKGSAQIQSVRACGKRSRRISASDVTFAARSAMN